MENSYFGTLDSHISPENSMWLAENLEGVNESVDKILRLIEEEYSAVPETEDCHLQKPELIAHLSKVRHMHKLLAERYYQLTKEVRMKFSSLVEMRQSGIPDSGTEQAAPFQTPDKKLSSDQAGDFKLLPSSGTGSPNFSLKDGSEYSMSSSDSDPESFYSTINKDLVSPMSVDSKMLSHKYVEPSKAQGTEMMVHGIKEESLYGSAKAKEFGNYDMLLKQVSEYEEELMITNEKLQSSENEKARLEGEVKKHDSVVVLMDNLKVQLDEAQRSISLRDADLQMEKEKVQELHNQVAELQSHIVDYKCNVEYLREKLKGSEKELVELKQNHCTEVAEGARKFQSQLESAHEDIALLEAKLNSEKDHVVELQDKILGYVAGISQQDQEIIALNAVFSGKKEQLQSDLSSLLEQNTKLNAIIEDFKMQISSLQSELYCCKSEKAEMKASHDAQVINWKVDIEKMKAEVKAKGEVVEAMNKNLDMLKLKYDMLMAEKDGVNAKLDNLNAELSSKNDTIQELNNRLYQLNLERVETIAESERARKHADELKLEVEELQNEVNRQVAVISERAEEKREAIRQLCFSLEHYRNGYQELRQAFTGHKNRSVLAS